jgi:aspartate carbamoyltransferase regulatory subunit
LTKAEELAKEAPEIDFGAIKNTKALEKMDPKALDAINSRKKTGKFNFTEPELVVLPSHGVLYNSDDEDVSNGHIRLLPMTIKEEEILTTSRFLKTGSATRMVFENCITSNIDAGEILLFDSNYILFKLRQLSYGDDYSFKIKCPNPVCEHEFEHTITISKLSFEEIPEGVKEPIVVKLPRSHYTVQLVYPRLRHSEDIFKISNNRKKSSGDYDKTRVDTLLATTILIEDTKGKAVSPTDWEEFYESILGEDRAELTAKTKLDTGIDKLEGVKCPYCEADYSGTIPVGIDFFRF